MQLAADLTASSAATFVIVTDEPGDIELQRAVAEMVAAPLGFRPQVVSANLSLDQQWSSQALPGSLYETLPAYLAAGSQSVCILPTLLDFSIFQQQAFGECISQAQRDFADRSIFCDEPDIAHPLLVQAFVDEVCARLTETGIAPQQTGLLLVASGHGDANSRADSYRLMRLLWEQLGLAAGEVAFLRHEQTPLPEQLARCVERPLHWILLPQMLWPGEHEDFGRVIFADFCRQYPQAAEWTQCRPIGGHANVAAWIAQRGLALWQQQRQRQATRLPSRRRNARTRPNRIHGPEQSLDIDTIGATVPAAVAYDGGVVADIGDDAALERLLKAYGIDDGPCFVKVTWHGYAPGTYTDAVALDRLLAALPGKAILLEGHSAGRNTGGADWDWEEDGRAHRHWLRVQEAEYLERTGLREVIERHGARYLNITEAYWGGHCAAAERVAGLVGAAGVELADPELCGFVPEVILDHPGRPLLSFARFKGPTRLSIANCFGLLPAPLRTAWHGPNITYFARVCCDMAQIYGALLEPFGLVEGFNAAVKWDRGGLYRSRWGHYDLIDCPGLLTMSRGFAIADILAARLQGQDVRRSAFYDVVQAVFGEFDQAAQAPIEEDLKARFA